jgi:hypothetical protein
MGHHDVGGNPSSEPIASDQHAFLPWELRVDALMWLLTDPTRSGGRRMTVDELRRGIESLPVLEYRELGYYAKWLRSMIEILAERGLVDRARVERRAAELAAEHKHEHEHGHE